MSMSIDKLVRWFFLGLVIIIVLAIAVPEAFAQDDCTQPHDQCGHTDDDNGDDGGGGANTNDAGADVTIDVGGQDQQQIQGQEQEASAFVTDSSTVSMSVNHARRAPTNFLYMQNQVEACGRTFGFSGSNTSGGWAFGVPIPRSWTPTCDLWKAANEAQENGHTFTSYMFMCSVNAVRKVWTEQTCAEFEIKSMGELGIITREITQTSEWQDVYNKAAQWDERWLVAEVTEDEYLEQQASVDDRIEQQQRVLDERAVLIDKYSKKITAQEVELDRVREAQETRKAEEEATREKFRAKLAAKEPANEN